MRYSLRTLMILTAVGPPLLAGLCLPKVSANSKVRTARHHFEFLASVVNLYCVGVGTLPPSLHALLAPPVDLPSTEKWKGPYWEKTQIPFDPWNNGYRYMVLDPFKNEFRVWSRGPDGI